MGNELQFPDDFKQRMPNESLDGEVWGGIGQFQEAVKLRSNATKATVPVDIKFVVFDLVDPESQKLPYTERYQKLLSVIDAEHPFLVSFKSNFHICFFDSNELVPSQILEESEQKRHEFENIIAKGGGEGLILTESNSPYECGNTDKVLKIKPERDAEALVICGDNKSLTVEMTNSTRFKILAPKQLHRELPKPGDVVTITFKRYVHGGTLPHRPEIKRVRRDLTWDEVKALSNDHPRSQDHDRDFSERWDIDIGGTREHLIQFAQNRRFDPLVPDNWYQISRKEICFVKGAATMLQAFGGSFIDALVASFPELSFDKSKFLKSPKHHWKNIQNIKAWFDDFAKTKHFDPLIADNWYKISLRAVRNEMGGHILKHHDYSHFKALKAAYPDIGLDDSKFYKVPNNCLKNTHAKVWFDDFARMKGFDPVIATNWYKVSFSDIYNAEGGPGVLHYSSHIKALKAAYPDIGLDKSKFSRVPSHYWNNTQISKVWFDNFARTKGFDPVVATNWYKVSLKDITNAKGGRGVLHGHSHIKALKVAYPDIGLDEFKFSSYYWKNTQNVKARKAAYPEIQLGKSKFSEVPRGKSHINALKATYPSIDLDESKFYRVPRNYWKNTQHIKVWFDDFARTKGFDPRIADNWYDVTREDICGAKGGHMLKYHGQSHIQALKAAYPDIGLDESKFFKAPSSFWKNTQNIKAWFDDFARMKGFDPLIADNWYSITRGNIIGAKGGDGVIKYHSRSHTKALKAAYPDIGLDESKFSNVPRNHWSNAQNIKAQFDDFARTKGFDPLIADNWYDVTREDICGEKGSGMLHGQSHIQALKATYPDIGLDESKFLKAPRNYWKNLQNVRAWLDEFAIKKGFDSRKSENWGKVKHSHIHAAKGGPGLLTAFHDSLKKILSAAYSFPY